MSSQGYVVWTPELLASLKAAHVKAEATDKTVFLFRGFEFEVDHAKSIIEFLETAFKEDENDGK